MRRPCVCHQENLCGRQRNSTALGHREVTNSKCSARGREVREGSQMKNLSSQVSGLLSHIHKSPEEWGALVCPPNLCWKVANRMEKPPGRDSKGKRQIDLHWEGKVFSGRVWLACAHPLTTKEWKRKRLLFPWIPINSWVSGQNTLGLRILVTRWIFT